MATKKTTSKKPSKKVSKKPVKAATKKTATKKAAPKKTATKKVASKKTVAKKPVTKKAPAKKKATSAKKTAPKKVAPKKASVAKKAKATKKAVKKAVKKVAKKIVPAKVVEKPKRPLVVAPTKPVLLVPKNTKTGQYTQSELIDCMTQYCGFEKKAVTKEFYEAFYLTLQAALKSGYKVMLPGLGKLQIRKTKARMGINPKTREPIKIPAKQKVAFTVAKALKDSVL